jgi:hypothetical protein
MSKALGITLDEFLLFSRPVAQLGAKSNLSVVVKDKKTGFLVGCSLRYGDADKSLSEYFKKFRLSTKFNPIFDILDKVRKSYHYPNAAYACAVGVD